jgi:predicted short-subunit dehydrogenase-like oxidoreductase (DUF2520 family)
MDEISSHLDAAGFDDVIGSYPKNRATICRAGGDEAGLGSPAGASFAPGRSFRHAITIKHSGRSANWLTSWRSLYRFPTFSAEIFPARRSTVSVPSAASLMASAMLPGMAAKPNIAIVGAGNLGTALAVALREAGYRIESVIARTRGNSIAQARRLARQTGARVVLDAGEVKAGVLWLCVPDGEIPRAAVSLAEEFHGRGKIALHSSGALGSDILEPLRRRGVAAASVHPLMTFVGGSRPSLVGVSFAIEGDPVAVRAARRIVRDLGGQSYPISRKEKSAYHAWGTFASPLLTALLATTEEVAALAGVSKKAARERMLPILLETVKNYGKLGAAAGFSGPIVRGDVETVRRHLEVLRTAAVPRQVYVVLAHAALEYLPTKNKKSLRLLLDSVDG